MLKQVRMTLVLLAILAISVPSLAASKMLQQFRSNAPSDTIFYWDGELSKIPSVNGSGTSQSSQLEQLLDQLQTIEEMPQATEILSLLIKDLADTLATDPDSVGAHYGLSSKQEVAFYFDGISPILQIAVKSPSAIKKLVIEMAESSEAIFVKENWMGKDVFTWQVDDDDEIGFAIVFDKKVITFGFYSNKDTENRTYRRLGLVTEINSVKSEKIAENIAADYRFKNAMTGYFNIAELARSFLSPETNSTGTDYLNLIIGEDEHKIQSDVCRKEWQSYADAVPKLIFGYTSINSSKSNANMQAAMILELTNSEVKTDLMKLNGHLSDYAVNNEGQIVSITQGLNTSEMSSVLTAFWTDFVNAEFECPELQVAQMSMQETNPASLAIASAMAQGLQGFGLSLFDITINDLETMDFTVDAIITLSGPNPGMLATLLANIPQLKDLLLPDDGTVVPLKNLGLPPEKTPSAMLVGNHLAIFLGDKAKATAKTLDKEFLNNRGLFGMYFDYSKVFDLVSNKVLNNQDIVGSMEIPACVEFQLGLQSIAELDAQLSMETRFDEDGINTTIGMDMTLPSAKSKKNFIQGEYSLEQMVDGCAWETVGAETINKDGTGTYEFVDAEAQCVTWKSDYNWILSGTRLKFDTQSSVSRNSCDEAFIEEESDAFECIITEQSDSGFTCLFSYEDDYKELYRYSRN